MDATSRKCPRCGKQTDAPESRRRDSNYICKRCHTDRQIARNARLAAAGFRRPNPTAAQEAARYRRDRADPAKRAKWKARSTAGAAIRRGALTRQPCEVCGAERVEAHHDDYSRPLEVRWLCPTHHREHHVAERAARKLAASEA